MKNCAGAILVAIMLALTSCDKTLDHTKVEAGPGTVKVKPFEFASPDLILLITGRTGGTLEMCNCRGPMPGGLSRRSGLVASYRQAFANTFLLDSGDVFWIEPESLRNDFVLKGYGLIGYDAVTLADQEWSPSPQRLRQLLTSQKLPYLATSLAPVNNVPPLDLSRQIVRQYGDIKLAVLSDVGMDSLLFLGEKKVQELQSSPDELERRARQLKREGCLVVIVAHGSADDTKRLAESGLADLVVRGHSTNSATTLQTADGDVWQGAASGTPVAKVGGYDMVGVVAIKLAGTRISQIDYRVEPVDERWPLDKRLLQTYQAYAHAEMRRALDAERKAGLEYVPSETCGKCHTEQYQQWKKSKHSNAYRTLTQAGRQGDPNCLMCHTSGFGTKKGFYTVQTTPKLANVNCQDCHRFNVSEHQSPSFQRPKLNEDTCTACHTAVTDPNFNMATRKAKIACPKGK